MRFAVAAAAVVAGLVAGIGPSIATHEDPCAGSTVTTATVPYGDTFYLDVRDPDNGIWTYRETNGIPGLQRGGESLLVEHTVEDPCIDDLTSFGPEAVPDELIL